MFPNSIFSSLRLFLYLILLASFTGAAYWAYNYWLDSVNPKKKHGSRHAAQSQPATGAATGVDGKKFDESWIPEYHIKSANSPKARGKAAK